MSDVIVAKHGLGAPGAGLTTTRSPLIEQAHRDDNFYIVQPYDVYSHENHQTWQRLYDRMEPKWARYANRQFLTGLDRLQFDEEAVPRLEDVNRFLEPLTGFKARAVSGYIPAFQFFDCLSRREFPTTITIRSADSLDYLPEPDIFHDISGHVPMHTDPAFAETLVRFGSLAHLAARRATEAPDSAQGKAQLSSVVKALSRFFWFSIEFGLMLDGDQLKAYGSGLLSSFGELEHAIESPRVQRHAFQMEWVINQAFEVDSYQPLLFTVDSFDHLLSLVEELEEWILAGRLDHVAAGEPEVRIEDTNSFLNGLQ
jgi:phenylalanine-4-hydroxylase